MGKLLDRAAIIEVPQDDFHVSTSSQQVLLVRLLGAPADIEDIELVGRLKLLDRLYLRVGASIKQRRRRLVVVIHR